MCIRDSLKTVLAIDYKIDSNTFCRYIKDDNLKMVSAYLDWGVDIDARDSNGRTPLITAIESNNYDIAKLLIENEASIYLQDLSGKYPKDFAKENNRMFDLLVANGLEVEAAEVSNIAQIDEDTLKEKANLVLSQDEVQNEEVQNVINLSSQDDVVASKEESKPCLLYTSPSPRDATLSRMPSSA